LYILISVVYTYTAETWGAEQADKYIEFLVLAIAELAESRRLGYCVNNRKNLRAYTAKWRKSKHGHRIIYREIKDGIYVLRILHTAMNLP